MVALIKARSTGLAQDSVPGGISHLTSSSAFIFFVSRLQDAS